MRVSNEGAASITASFPSIANFHLGTGADNTVSESAVYDAARDAVVETGARGTLVAQALSASSNHTMTPSDPFPLVRDGQPLPTVDASGVLDNVVHGFTFAPAGGALAAGASFTFGALYATTSSSSGAALEADVAAYVAGRSPQQILDDELAASRAFVQSARVPSGLSAGERALFGHSLALLRAAQVRAAVDVPGAGDVRRRPVGQIVASLPPGEWNITWVRDASYATEALLHAGKLDEATSALRFFLDGDAGEYQAFVGRDYLISVVRTFGGGREESDENAGGPNIEWDDFGLFLRAFARALDDGAPLDADVAAVKDGVADVLLSLVDPSTGLLVPDSSIWETHWDASFESAGRRQYTYSSACASAGLAAFADALDARAGASGDADAARYRAAAQALAQAIDAHLVDGSGALAADREELVAGGGTLDAAVVAAFNRDVLDPGGAVAHATLDEIEAGLRASTTPGYFRNDEGGDYDRSEWLSVDLWLARAFRRAGNTAEADRLLAHVTQVGVDNLGQVPELLRTDPSLGPVGAADGATPMMGFGAGAYVTALFDRAADEAVGEGEGEGDVGEGEGEGEGEGDVGEGEGEGEGEGGEGEGEGEGGEGEGEGAPGPVEHEGCGCTSSATPADLAALALLLVFARPRRRRRQG